MVTLTNDELLESIGALNQLNSLLLPVKAAYAVGKQLRAVNKALKVYQQVREKIDMDFAERDAKGNVVPGPFPGSHKHTDEAGFMAALKELGAESIEIPVHKIDIALVLSAKGDVPPSVFSALEWLFNEPEEEKKNVE